MTTDSQDFVQKVERMDGSTIVLNPAVTEKLCMGPWHKKNGKGTLLPINEFSIVRHGKSKGQMAVSCRSCTEKNRNYLRRVKARGTDVESVVTNGEVSLTPVLYQGPELPTWRVTIVKKTVVLVNARDYLDAGVAAGEGDVVMIEKLT